MYRHRDGLELLIQSLTKAERSYFSSSYDNNEDEEKRPFFLQLYHLYKEGKSEQSKIFKQYGPQVLTTTKRRLYDNILKTLRSFHHDISVDAIIQNHLLEIEILYNHSLPEQSLFILKKAHDLAIRYEKFGLLLQILDWERKLNIVLVHPERSLNEIVVEEEEVHNKLVQTRSLENIYSKAKDLKKLYGYIKGEMVHKFKTETIDAIGGITYEKCLSQRAKFYFDFIHVIYYGLVLEHVNAYRYSNRLISSGWTAVLPGDYIAGMLEHLTSSFFLGYFQDVLNKLTLADQYIQKHRLNQSPTFNIGIFYHKITYLLVIFNYMGNKEKLEEAILLAETKIQEYGKMMSHESRQVVLGNLMNAYMGIGNFKKANEIFDLLFKKESKNVRRDIYDDLYFFQLFNLLQSKSYSVIPSAAQSAYRYFRQFEDYSTRFPLEIKIAALLQKDHNYDSIQAKNRVLRDIKTIIEVYLSSLKGINNFQEHFTLYLIWTDAIINDEPFHVTARKWYKEWVMIDKCQVEDKHT